MLPGEISSRVSGFVTYLSDSGGLKGIDLVVYTFWFFLGIGGFVWDFML